MAVDNRPFKSKEQDGQGNEVIIRDQQLVEQGTTTTMPAGTYFQTLDVDGRPVKIPKDNMLNLIVEGLGIIFNGQSDQQTVTKVPTLNGNNFGASTVATLASVLGAQFIDLKTSLDLNSAKATAKYNVGPSYVSGVSNLPSVISSSPNLYSLIIDVIAADNYIVQKVYVVNVNYTFQRTCVNNTWSDWQRTDNYGTSTISELASALGVKPIISSNPESVYTNMGNNSFAFVFDPTYAVSSIIMKNTDGYGYRIGVNAGSGTAILYMRSNGTWQEGKSII